MSFTDARLSIDCSHSPLPHPLLSGLPRLHLGLRSLLGRRGKLSLYLAVETFSSHEINCAHHTCLTRVRKLLLTPVSPSFPSLVHMSHNVPSCWCVCAPLHRLPRAWGQYLEVHDLPKSCLGFALCGIFSVLVRTLLETDTEPGKIPSTMFTIPFTNRGVPFPVYPSCQGLVYLQFQRLMPPRTAPGRNHGNKYLITESTGPDKWLSKD